MGIGEESLSSIVNERWYFQKLETHIPNTLEHLMTIFSSARSEATGKPFVEI